jgi:UDP-N-acetylmuramoylalanine--D-glutamate ligase
MVAEELAPGDLAILEVSSFQLESVQEFAPRVGAVLNLAPDHLDRYPDLAAYYGAKKVLADRVPAGGTFITWTECPVALAWPTAADRVLFGQENRGAQVFFRDGRLWTALEDEALPLLDISALALQSPPNLLNALAGAAIGLALDLDPESVAAGLQDFPGLPHRHQLVAKRGGVAFINDSKATNVHAVCAGLAGFPDPVVLIAGGSGKGEDYRPLREVMDQVRQVVLIGQEGPAIGRTLRGAVPTLQAGSLEEAVAMAAKLAEPDAVVLLSPACASFDMFANYGERGEAFVKAALATGAEPVG